MQVNVSTAVLAAAIVATAEIVAAPEQGTLTPGQMTQAKVWVQNRGGGEAVPVDLRDVNLDTPLAVHVINGEPGRGASTTPLQVRIVRPIWDYQMVIVAANQDLAVRLNTMGANGWETTGIMFSDANGTRVLLKRQR